MKWCRINDYAITNGQEFAGPDNAYKHGTHFISKSLVNGVPRYTLWDGEVMIKVFRTLEEAKAMVKEVESV